MEKVFLGGLDKNVDLMVSIQHFLLTGCGTSRHAAEMGAKIMRDLDVGVLDAGELRRSDIPGHYGGLIAVSQSGETKDVQRAT
jgi:fructoselysine-6-P-deglycase FrlB-like protein